MCLGDAEKDPRSVEEAAECLSSLIERYCGVAPEERGLVKMLWSDFNKAAYLAHKIHDARPSTESSDAV